MAQYIYIYIYTHDYTMLNMVLWDSKIWLSVYITFENSYRCKYGILVSYHFKDVENMM